MKSISNQYRNYVDFDFRIYFETKIYDLRLDTEFGHCLQTSILEFDENPTADKNVVTDSLLTAY